MPSTLPGTIDAIVDLNHDNAIDMVKAVNDGIVAVIHKASESASFKDPKYIKRRKAALDGDLRRQPAARICPASFGRRHFEELPAPVCALPRSARRHPDPYVAGFHPLAI
jgi:hypothetical protein